MAGWGVLLVILGLGSFGMNMMGREFQLLMWVDSWGPLVGNIIRFGIAALGGLMIILGVGDEEE